MQNETAAPNTTPQIDCDLEREHRVRFFLDEWCEVQCLSEQLVEAGGRRLAMRCWPQPVAVARL